MNEISHKGRGWKVSAGTSEDGRAVVEEPRSQGIQTGNRKDLSVANTRKRGKKVFGEVLK